MDSTSPCDFGMIGLGVMGRNFLLNVADHQFQVMGYDLDQKKVKALQNEKENEHIQATNDLSAFINSLKSPRKLMMLIPAGHAVDSVIDQVTPLLDEGDIIIDGGNSHFKDTERRTSQLSQQSIHFVGMGVSGGEQGARYGPSLMPGGERKAYELLRPILESAAAKVKGVPCVAFLGKGSAGHYVKMVHNGIEYGIMQLLAEVYDILKRVGGLTDEELHQTFMLWNQGGLNSFLVEITAKIFAQPDDKVAGERLINYILDSAKQKGTGKWTSQSAMDLGVAIPTIDAAVSMRYLSSLKNQRSSAANVLHAPGKQPHVNKDAFIKIAEEALHFSMLITYAQGFAMLKEASVDMEYELNLAEVAKIWRGGCIIRAQMLDDFMEVFSKSNELANLMVAPSIAQHLNQESPSIRQLLATCVQQGIPAAAMSASLSYFESYRTARLPSNLVQAQRDFFGAHTYERTDTDGVFHTRWGATQD